MRYSLFRITTLHSRSQFAFSHKYYYICSQRTFSSKQEEVLPSFIISRGIFQIQGEDAGTFLQAFMANAIERLSEGVCYTAFLRANVRIGCFL